MWKCCLNLSRMALLFTGYGENLVPLINVKSIGASFSDPIDRDGTLILSRDKKRKYKEMAEAQMLEGDIFGEEDFESDEDEEDDY